MKETCAHLKMAKGRRTPVEPRTLGCQECIAIGSEWVQLRLCLTCGHVGCCDSSLNRHATAHFLETTHPVIKAFEPDENWAWCYVDEQIATMPEVASESPDHHIPGP